MLDVPFAEYSLEDPWEIPERCRPVELRRAIDGGVPRLTTIVAGYFDSGNGARSGTGEAGQAAGIAGVQGFMYTTWYGDYSQLEAYAAAVRAGS